MVKRKIVRIDESKCDGCGLCVPACEEGAIKIENGKAKLVDDRMCDGLGDCLGECPQGAIEIIEREADPFDEALVEAQQQESGGGCPGAMGYAAGAETAGGASVSNDEPMSPCQRFNQQSQNPQDQSQHQQDQNREKNAQKKAQWPVQLNLVSPNAPFFQGADLVISADCVPFAYPHYHDEILGSSVQVVGCPKLDDASAYVDKLAQIFSLNPINSVTLARMEVPCCKGLKMIVEKAMEKAGVEMPVEEKVISIQGKEKVNSSV